MNRRLQRLQLGRGWNDRTEVPKQPLQSRCPALLAVLLALESSERAIESLRGSLAERLNLLSREQGLGSAHPVLKEQFVTSRLLDLAQTLKPFRYRCALSAQRIELTGERVRRTRPAIATGLELSLQLPDATDTDEFADDVEALLLFLSLDELSYFVLLKVHRTRERSRERLPRLRRRLCIWPQRLEQRRLRGRPRDRSVISDCNTEM